MQAKGIGELGICGAGGAVLNAIYNACGVRVRDLPATPERVLIPPPAAMSTSAQAEAGLAHGTFQGLAPARRIFRRAAEKILEMLRCSIHIGGMEWIAATRSLCLSVAASQE